MQFAREQKNGTVKEFILLNMILRNHLLSEHIQ